MSTVIRERIATVKEQLLEAYTKWAEFVASGGYYDQSLCNKKVKLGDLKAQYPLATNKEEIEKQIEKLEKDIEKGTYKPDRDGWVQKPDNQVERELKKKENDLLVKLKDLYKELAEGEVNAS